MNNTDDYVHQFIEIFVHYHADHIYSEDFFDIDCRWYAAAQMFDRWEREDLINVSPNTQNHVRFKKIRLMF